MSELIANALKSNAWPFKEAEALLKKLNNTLPTKGYVLFETGYGPSGLPHIGTFGEVLRTTMVRKAFELISNMPTRLLCVSDDMDGMRKIPDLIPNKEEYKKYLDLPLTSIPDPFNIFQSFGENMNARLRSFLDDFGFEYEFVSSTKCYRSGVFNEMLLKALTHYDEIMEIMLPTLGEERRATYSPFLPVCPSTGKVLQVPIIDRDVVAGMIRYKDLEGKIVTVPVTDGCCKLQWKPDFAMRWAAFDVDFEIYGKDHLVNGPIYTKICEVLVKKAPYQSYYELFLDEQGQKISKTKGNGITIDEWLRYAPKESLSLFMYLSPKTAKKLYFAIIPKHVDEYLNYLKAYYNEPEEKKKFSNPVYHIHGGTPPKLETTISYSLLLNLVSAIHADDANLIWKYLKRYDANLNQQAGGFVDGMIKCAMNYYQDFIRPNQKFREASEAERSALVALKNRLLELDNANAEEIQTLLFTIGKEYEFDLKLWFQALYEILLGFSQGPRFGSFIALYGVSETVALIDSKLDAL